MTDANGTRITEASEVTTGGDPTPLTVVAIGTRMIQVAVERDHGLALAWLYPSDCEVVEKETAK